MAYFTDADEVYRLIGGLFEQILADPEVAEKYKKANLVVQYRYTNPESVLTVKMTDDASIEYGETELQPDVTMFMEADLAHKFWLGEANPTMAMATKKLRMEGSIGKAMKLLPLARKSFPRYQALVAEHERGGAKSGASA